MEDVGANSVLFKSSLVHIIMHLAHRAWSQCIGESVQADSESEFAPMVMKQCHCPGLIEWECMGKAWWA
jgi:hypothetical protein